MKVAGTIAAPNFTHWVINVGKMKDGFFSSMKVALLLRQFHE
jgi:hypothetical protein